MKNKLLDIIAKIAIKPHKFNFRPEWNFVRYKMQSGDQKILINDHRHDLNIVRIVVDKDSHPIDKEDARLKMKRITESPANHVIFIKL